MHDHAAIATLTPMGAEISWLPPATGPAVATMVDLLDELRALANRRPQHEVSILVRDMGQQARFEAGAVTVLTVDATGNSSYLPSSQEEWARANAPTLPADPAPMFDVTQQTAPPDVQASAGGQPQTTINTDASGIEALFGQSFATSQAQTTMLPQTIIATANTKGGAAKTTLAIAVVSAAAHLAGHNDVALLDINPSGNLAEHTVQSAGANIIDLAHAATRPSFGQVRADLDPFINWQPGGWLTINCPASIVSNDGGIISDLDDQDIQRITHVLQQHCRFLLFDTGNNAKDPAWQSVAAHAHRILVPIQWEPDTVIEAQKMITDMAAAGHSRLKERIIFVGTHAPSARPDRKRKRGYRAALEQSGWRVMDLPPDRHIATGGIIEWDKLRSRTKEAATAIVRAILP